MSDIVLSGKKWYLQYSSLLLSGPFSCSKFPRMCKQPFRRKKNLGVIFRHFKFDKQISTVVKTSFFQLRLLAKIKPYRSLFDQERVVTSSLSDSIIATPSMSAQTKCCSSFPYRQCHTSRSFSPLAPSLLSY